MEDATLTQAEATYKRSRNRYLVLILASVVAIAVLATVAIMVAPPHLPAVFTTDGAGNVHSMNRLAPR